MRRYLAERFGWDINTIDEQDKYEVDQVLFSIKKEQESKLISADEDEAMDLSEFVKSGVAHKMGIN